MSGVPPTQGTPRPGEDPTRSSRFALTRDPSVARRLALDGYARLGGVVGPDTVAAARGAVTEAIERLGRPLGDDWFPSITLPEVEVRDLISVRLTEILGPTLHAVLAEDAELLRLDASVKPPSPTSALGPHQDFSIVDERRFASLYLWVPLIDTDAVNGTLHVVPGSHRFANGIRAQHVPAVFDEVLDLVHDASVRLDCSVGDLVLMVSGVIHHSPANRSEAVRLAAHGIVKPTAAPIVFSFVDEATPPDEVECYEVDMATYIEGIRAGRPGPGGPRPRLVPRQATSMTPERFRAGVREVRAIR